jgi:chromate transporter
MSTAKAPTESTHSAASVFITFLRLGLTSFGGPIAHIGYFRRELVERQRWVNESQFSQLLAICQFLPGPASSQLGFALGLLRAGWLGALSAFIAFTLPSVLLLIGFATALPLLSGPFALAAIHGLKLVACSVVADAVLGMSKTLCPDPQRRGIALAAAAILLILEPAWVQIAVVVAGAFGGMLLCRSAGNTSQVPIDLSYGKRLGIILLILFIILLVTALFLPQTQASLTSTAQAFYRSGALVFGGGHVVLPLLEDSVVTSGWIDRETFLAGYGAAQAIPGPMFAFSAYLGMLIPDGSTASLGASIALIFMFLPGFLLVSAILPLWRAVSSYPRVTNAISGVNAAVVGLLAAALYDPIFVSGIDSSIDLAIALIGFGMLAIRRLSPLWVVLWCVGASLFAAWL